MYPRSPWFHEVPALVATAPDAEGDSLLVPAPADTEEMSFAICGQTWGYEGNLWDCKQQLIGRSLKKWFSQPMFRMLKKIKGTLHAPSHAFLCFTTTLASGYVFWYPNLWRQINAILVWIRKHLWWGRPWLANMVPRRTQDDQMQLRMSQIW